jgi:hypothetical protein
MTKEQALNRLSLVQQSLRFLADQLGGKGLGSLLQLLADDLEACLIALD